MIKNHLQKESEHLLDKNNFLDFLSSKLARKTNYLWIPKSRITTTINAKNIYYSICLSVVRSKYGISSVGLVSVLWTERNCLLIFVLKNEYDTPRKKVTQTCIDHS